MPRKSFVNQKALQKVYEFFGGRKKKPSIRKPKTPKYVKGVYKGRYFRRRLPEKQEPPAALPKLPLGGSGVMPQPLTKYPPPIPPPLGQQQTTTTATQDFLSRLFAWFKKNTPVLILNFGSVCTLVGFTRQDVLELRAFSMTGSISFCIYQLFQTPRPLAPIAWSGIFACVNADRIYRILDERKAKVVLTEHEEQIFVEHFMQHGVTPKQFEKIMSKAKIVQVKKGDCIVRQGDEVKSVRLVVSGKTRANFLGRHLTAISSSPNNKESKVGGDSGAWIGEMTFLEAFGQKEREKFIQAHPPQQQAAATKTTANNNNTAKDGKTGTTEDAKSSDSHETKTEQASPSPTTTTTSSPSQTRRLGAALYTIVAAEDCEILMWSHEDVEDLMHMSNDMRAAMTRAMTAPIVGKVINFTVSRTTNMPTWSTWLDDWKHSGANTSVNVVGKQKSQEGIDSDEAATEGAKLLEAVSTAAGRSS